MNGPDFADVLGPLVLQALEQRGFKSLTPVQEAVLDPALAGRDLRITSQTGSGKTVAVGFALLAFVRDAPKGGTPVAMVVAPTRELARQFEEELAWLYASLDVRVASLTGGASYLDERRSLSKRPGVIVGTPGRLLDHLKRGSLDAKGLQAIVLDEADRMLDLGFKDELDAIFTFVPEGHRTHLVSATFPPGVRRLADSVQTDPAHVEGTPLGAANADIDHVIHLLDPRELVNAIINILLAYPEEQTLVFARTRAGVADLTQSLAEAGFAVSSISGEMEQPARNRALAQFKSGKLRALIATDVAARGIDVQDIARVIHADPPTDPDTYTHRSGRTGRAGRKGTSSILVSPSALGKTTIVLRRARLPFRFEPIPTAEAIRQRGSDRLFEELTRDDAPDATGLGDDIWNLAKRLAAGTNVTRSLARLLDRTGFSGPTEPRSVRVMLPPSERREAPRAARSFPSSVRQGFTPSGVARGLDNGGPAPRGERGAAPKGSRTFVPFRVSWGQEKGAEARKLMAIVCRRGNIRGSDVGAIRVARRFSIVEVASDVADSFADAVKDADPRSPETRIARDVSTPNDARPPRRHEGPPHPKPAPYAHPSKKHDAPAARAPVAAKKHEGYQGKKHGAHPGKKPGHPTKR